MTQFIGFLFFIALVLALSCIIPGLWYCIDDFLAGATGAEWVGQVPFLVTWVITIILGALLRSGASNSNG